MIQIVLVLLTALNGPIVAPQYTPYGAGGPDAYGYRWIDSDTTGPSNVPTFAWKDISTIGTRVTGLGDDNVVGPFSIGFNFPYYWYRVSSFYICSNGYIAFGDNTMAAAGFTEDAPPNPNRPNNMVAPLLSDFDFSVGTPSCYYWSNAAHDTCVITYQNVCWWNMSASCCSSQIILTKADSSITFQYKKISGTPYGGWSGDDNATGIENVTGTVGLSYLWGLIPSQNVLHDTLAVRFYPPATTSYQVTDVGIRNALSDNSGGCFLYNNSPQTMWANVMNSGNQSVGTCSVFCRVRNAGSSVVYSSSAVIASMIPGQVDSISFTPAWTPTVNGTYSLVFRSKVAGDIYSPNDSVIIESRVITYPAELMYDDGVADASYYWNGSTGGYGAKFTPPRYPCKITGGKASLNMQATATTCTLFVFKADGPGGTPGTILGRGNINVNSATATWYQITLNSTINSGSFFVGVTSDGATEPSYSMDTTPPISGQTWEYTGVWAPSRDATSREGMFRALVDLGSGVEELGPAIAINQPTLSAHPNPFTTNTKIMLNGKVNQFSIVKIYNALGEQVNKLSTSNDFLLWNGTDYSGSKLSPGIYFAKLETENAPVTKILISD